MLGTVDHVCHAVHREQLERVGWTFEHHVPQSIPDVQVSDLSETESTLMYELYKVIGLNNCSASFHLWFTDFHAYS